ncbi:hypothetical protein H2201_000868 [Coniosporium apollinis]|uniref:Kinesin family member 1/13/14 n=1 Tax=Coniosporium apollinis TaxID=61459 RepID=A0ABQ9P3T6_9PEZI|nr:hypothetical protein H2201_000868 [Coniosporium apollinis]
MAAAGGGNIKVVVRVRPFNGRELDRKAKCVVHMQNNQTILTPPNAVDPRSKGSKAALEGTKIFAFDKSYWSFSRDDPHFADQDDLFSDLGKPLLDNAFRGYNNCIFAYGQTGSGKSYSMMGYGKEAGVIPKICRDMFDRIDEMQQDSNLNCRVEVSYLEIYNERVRDLLNPSTKGNLKVREHPSTGPYVEDLAKLVVRSFREIESLMDEGNKARTVAATNMNETSSRSHAVFTLTLTQKRHDAETNIDMEKVAKISLVDLAGSERATSTGATGARLKEGAEINRSLSTLGRVIAALADLSTGKKKSASMVPYRDSVLTWLLKDSLGGNSLTAMIAAISPADINFEETLSTLRYADSAKRIKNHAVVNEDANARMIRELKEELAQLRSKLSGGATPGAIAGERHAPDTPLDVQMVSITQADGTLKTVSKAEIAEQLNQSEKLYKDLNQTWEEKLARTEEIHRERESALEELGISIEKGFVGLSTPKRMPHLVNLSDDPLLAECLVYNLKPGTTTVGNGDTATSAEIRLNGSKILHDHCVFENADGIVTVVPKDGATVMVNGIRIEKPKRLRSGYRVILGDFHIFRFNHPQEARAERAEQVSLLRQSVLASELGSSTPTRPGHERSWSNISRAESDVECDSPRAASPFPTQRSGRDSDWAFARREAATAILGSDQKISNLTDDELDVLFDDLQRVRAGRKGRPESRLFDTEDDLDSVTSCPMRDKDASNSTLDNLSLDTVLTIPSTPQLGEEDERLRLIREDMQTQLDKQKEDYQEKLKVAEESLVQIEEVRAEKVQIEENLRTAREDMQKLLQLQKDDFERQLKELREPTPQVTSSEDASADIAIRHDALARHVFDRWRQCRYVAMAETVLRNAVTLKEAQVMSRRMDKHVVFQFCIIDIGHLSASSYDLVMNGISGEDDDDLQEAQKPCIGVRVVDFKNTVVHRWSLQKLRQRVLLMRQMNQYIDRPGYSRHLRLENPFSEACLPKYSHVGDVDVPLVAVFESRVQDFALDIVSPYTFNVVGILRLSLEPSSAEAPSSTLKFNVVMHDMVGFAEREGTDVHAQLFVSGTADEGGATTTQTIRNFDEGPIRFESVHSMSLPSCRNSTFALRISIFAKVTALYLDSLLSWDDLRDTTPRPKQKRHNSRLPESEFYSEDRHDVFTAVQIHEISEDGTYRPTEVFQRSPSDTGIYQLHQGLQRRIVITVTHSSGLDLQWKTVSHLRVSHIRLLDCTGRSPDLGSPSREIRLALVSRPAVKEHANGTTSATLVGYWDSSAHGSQLLDRVTAENHRVQLSLLWCVECAKLADPVHFSLDLTVQIQSRSRVQPTSKFMKLLWNPTVRILYSTTGIFSLALRPTAAKRAVDLWRMDTQHGYVAGEELLNGWTPRGVSLIRDFIALRRRRVRTYEVETTRCILGRRALTVFSGTEPVAHDTLTERQEQLLRKVLALWHTKKDIGEAILRPSNTDPPPDGAVSAANNGTTPRDLVAEVSYIPKNPDVLKAGYLACLDDTNTRWVRRFVEFRKPYLHLYAVPEGNEINAINLANARIDHEPQVAKLLRRPNIFAVFAPGNSFLFAAGSIRDRTEWIFRIDQSFVNSESSASEDDV